VVGLVRLEVDRGAFGEFGEFGGLASPKLFALTRDVAPTTTKASITWRAQRKIQLLATQYSVCLVDCVWSVLRLCTWLRERVCGACYSFGLRHCFDHLIKLLIECCSVELHDQLVVQLAVHLR
jgi:hypothetical protein